MKKKSSKADFMCLWMRFRLILAFRAHAMLEKITWTKAIQGKCVAFTWPYHCIPIENIDRNDKFTNLVSKENIGPLIKRSQHIAWYLLKLKSHFLRWKLLFCILCWLKNSTNEVMGVATIWYSPVLPVAITHNNTSSMCIIEMLIPFRFHIFVLFQSVSHPNHFISTTIIVIITKTVEKSCNTQCISEKKIHCLQWLLLYKSSVLHVRVFFILFFLSAFVLVSYKKKILGQRVACNKTHKTTNTLLLFCMQREDLNYAPSSYLLPFIFLLVTFLVGLLCSMVVLKPSARC